MKTLLTAFSLSFLWQQLAVAAFFIATLMHAASAGELIQPPVCSPLKPIPRELKGICKIKKEVANHHKITVNLTAHTSHIEVGGYKVETQHYNKFYLTPVIEALPGDVVAAHLQNSLTPVADDGTKIMTHGVVPRDTIPTNLHYFHGGIVTPNNSRPMDARKGDGDNIYVWLENGAGSNTFDFKVPIPGEGGLDAQVLEGEGFIPHPNGLNWYHSHLHGISSQQVMGGMSGLLSVGEDKAAIQAKCNERADANECKKETEELKKRTIVRYALLRDISLKKISATPIENKPTKQATWAPDVVDFGPPDNICKVWRTKASPSGSEDPRLREGFCQRDQDSAWLFTLNGQRFPTITVEGGQNLLLRLGNLSSNVAYWLELEHGGRKIPLTILTLDGVVPAKPTPPERAKIPVDALEVNDLLLMPASRAEIYIRNDTEGHSTDQIFILRTKGLNAGFDTWPEIQLARIKLKASKPKRGIALALNVPVQRPAERVQPPPVAVGPPKGCLRDLNPAEHRRVTFTAATPKGGARGAVFGIKTEIVSPPDQTGYFEESKFNPVENVYASFEEYELGDGSIDWEANNGPKHVCIHLDHKGSHKQLWVLKNDTGLLHNFHIHQMKFRLATLQELIYDYHTIPDPQGTKDVCSSNTEGTGPNYKLCDMSPNPKTIWHDTIPVPGDAGPVFIIMSFDADQQVGRFVYHCHILKHEDLGLMAPIEVYGP